MGTSPGRLGWLCSARLVDRPHPRCTPAPGVGVNTRPPGRSAPPMRRHFTGCRGVAMKRSYGAPHGYPSAPSTVSTVTAPKPASASARRTWSATAGFISTVTMFSAPAAGCSSAISTFDAGQVVGRHPGQPGYRVEAQPASRMDLPQPATHAVETHAVEISVGLSTPFAAVGR